MGGDSPRGGRRAGDGAGADNMPRALLGWVAGCSAIWSALFTIGNALYGRWAQASVLLAVFVVSALALTQVLRRLWPERDGMARA